jgi:hypothetical protein
VHDYPRRIKIPRLSLYRPEKGNDFKFLDRVINEEFQVGGVDLYIHKYLGPVDPNAEDSSPALPVNSNPIPELGIQDLILMENRDRHYDPDIYVIRGIYDMQDIDFNLSQFGMFLQNDTIFVMLHLRTHFEALGRKIIAGDVVELPHKKDEYALTDSSIALKRFYVVQDVTRPAKGYSQTWYPHLVRAKCVPLIDSQEFSEIFEQDTGAGDGSTLRDLISTYQKNIEINDQIVLQATLDAPKSGYDTRRFYIIPFDQNGLVSTNNTSNDLQDASNSNPISGAGVTLSTPSGNMYVGYLTEDGIPPNGYLFGSGIEFPSIPSTGEFYLRTDYVPNRLFRFDGHNWVKFKDKVRMTLNNLGNNDVKSAPFIGQEVQQTLKSSFINNDKVNTINGQTVVEKQALSKALRPKADH